MEGLMKKIFGVVSALVLLVSCGQPKPATVAGKLEKSWQNGFASGYKAIVANGLMIVPAERDVIAVDIYSGNIDWKYESPKEKLWSCINCQQFNDGYLATFESSAGSLVVALDRNGKEIKQYENPRVSSVPTVVGQRFWQVQSNTVFGNVTEFKIEPSLPVIAASQDLTIFYVSESNVVRASDRFGKILWYAKLYDSVQNLWLIGDSVYSHSTKGIACFNAKDGKFAWQLICLPVCQPIPSGDELVIPTDKSILIVDRNGKTTKTVDMPGIISLDKTDDGYCAVAHAKLVTMDKNFKVLEKIDTTDGTHQAIIAPGVILTNGTTGQACYKLIKD